MSRIHRTAGQAGSRDEREVHAVVCVGRTGKVGQRVTESRDQVDGDRLML